MNMWYKIIKTVQRQNSRKHTQDKIIYNQLYSQNTNQLFDEQINLRPHSQKGKVTKHK